MVEVFKTNVNEPFHAEILLRIIYKSFGNCIVSFDLEDCDKILRIESSHVIEKDRLIKLIQSWGFDIETLSDDIITDNNGTLKQHEFLRIFTNV